MTKPISLAFNLPFDEAIAAIKAKGVVLPREYRDLLKDEKRQQAFTVSGLASLDQVQSIKDQLTAHLQDGGTLGSFQKWAKDQDFDLPRHRLETIYRNGVQTAYNAGHWRAFEDGKDERGYLMYDAVNDGRTRPTHRALDNTIRPVGDPFWATHSPPLGHRCRCRLTSLSQDQAIARSRNGTGLNKTVTDDMKADPGWGSKPTWQSEKLGDIKRQKLVKATGKIREAGIEALDNARMESKGKGIEDEAGIDRRILDTLSKNEVDARAYVLGNGRRTGFEYLYAFDADSGKVLTRHTDGRIDSVGMTSTLTAVAGIVIYHNHPNNSPPSATDLSIIGTYEGISFAAVNGHDDSWYRITPMERGNINKALDVITPALRRFSLAYKTRYLSNELDWIVAAARIDALSRSGIIHTTSNVKIVASRFGKEITELSADISGILGTLKE